MKNIVRFSVLFSLIFILSVPIAAKRGPEGIHVSEVEVRINLTSAFYDSGKLKINGKSSGGVAKGVTRVVKLKTGETHKLELTLSGPNGSHTQTKNVSIDYYGKDPVTVTFSDSNDSGNSGPRRRR